MVMASSGKTQAQTFTWLNPLTGTTNWSAGSWSPSTPPTGGATTVSLIFQQIGTGTYTASNDLGNPFVLGNLFFISSGGGITVNNLASNSLEFNNALGPAGIFMPDLGNSTLATGAGGNTVLNTSLLNITQSPTAFGSLAINTILTGGAAIEINVPTPTNITNFVDLGSANTFGGGVTLNSGNLRLSSTTPLGSGQLTINGGSLGTTGALTISNNIVLNSADLINTGSITLSGVISQSGAIPRSVRHMPTASSITLTMTNTNTYTGVTSVGINPLMSANGPVSGSLTLSGQNGAIPNSTFIEITTGTLTINTATAGQNNNDRINDGATIRSVGGTVLLTGGNAVTTLENVGTLAFSGSTFVTIDAGTTGNTGTTLQSDSLARINRGQILFRANNANFGQPIAANVANMIFDTAPGLIGGGGAPGSTTISIIPYAIGGTTTASTGTELVTYGANGVRPLSTTAEYATTITSGSTTANNVRLTAAAAITAPTTINALVVATTTPFTGSTSTLTLSAGTLLHTSAFTLPTAMTLDFGSAEGCLFNNAAMTVDGTLLGSSGLTKTGGSNLILNASANVNVSGPLTINQGGVQFADATKLNSFSLIIMNGRSSTTTPGLVLSGATTSQNVNKQIVSTEGFARFTGSTTAGVFLVIDGQLTGPGGFITTGGGNVELTNTSNNFQGQFRHFSGNLRFGSDAVFGNAPSIDIGTLATSGIILSGNWTTNRPINFSFSSQLDTNGFDMVMNGRITGVAGTINKVGAGRWEITTAGALGQSVTAGASATTTTVNINAGELRVTNPFGSATGTATVNINNAGTILSGTGRMAGVVTVAAPSIIAPGLGGTTQGVLSADSNLIINGTYEVDGDLFGGSDLLFVANNLTLGGASVIDFKNPANYAPGTVYTLAVFNGTLTGTFATTLNLPPSHTLLYAPNSILLVPEPTSVLGFSALGLLACRFARRRLARA